MKQIRIPAWFIIFYGVGLFLISIGIGVHKDSLAVGLISVGLSFSLGLFIPILFSNLGIIKIIDSDWE